MKATYSPEDNKLRIYPENRLEPEVYAQVKNAGFIWAAKQGLFVAPRWTPERFDFLVNLCGDVEDEDTSLVQRAEQRAERFETYSDKRESEAHAAKERAQDIAGTIPLGQPILVGHHSQAKAERDALKIKSAMEKAVKLWDTSKYWEDRAAGVLSSAKYKEKPEVRARRIKTLGADMRKHERTISESERFLRAWEKVDSLEKAKAVANYDFLSFCFPLDKYPRNAPASQYEGSMSLWSALDGGVIGYEKAREIALGVHTRRIPHNSRWVEHYKNRIAYETALLNEQGAGKLIEKKERPKQLPLCNYSGTVTVKGRYGKTPETFTMHHMTKAEYSASNSRGTWESADGTHRVKVTCIPDDTKPRYMWKFGPVFLTDSKVTEPPKAAPVKTEPEPEPPKTAPEPERIYSRPEKTEFDSMRESLENGINVISAPQLFPTPEDLAARMVQEADILPDHKVLEPSAGTGAILKAIGPAPDKTAVEISPALVAALTRGGFSGLRIVEGDFLDVAESLGTFDRVLMNPPFANAQDIVHIQKAASLLNSGGVLVAICANGPRQNDKLKPWAENSGGFFEPLPAGTFKESGTNVNTAILVFHA